MTKRRVQIAFYKGPAKSIWQKIAHRVICVRTGSIYSHCELVIDGVCYSASARDGGVRAKTIDLASGKWDVYDWPKDSTADYALSFYGLTRGCGYDWAGVFRFLLPILPVAETRWWCSEWVAAALRMPEWDSSPQRLWWLCRLEGALPGGSGA